MKLDGWCWMGGKVKATRAAQGDELRADEGRREALKRRVKRLLEQAEARMQ